MQGLGLEDLGCRVWGWGAVVAGFTVHQMAGAPGEKNPKPESHKP